MKRFPVIVMFLFLLMAPPLMAQKLAGYKPLGKGKVAIDKGAYAAVTAKYFAGDYGGLRTELEMIFAKGAIQYLNDKGESIDSQHTFDFNQNFYSFVFVAQDPNAADPQVVRVLTYPAEFRKYYAEAGANSDLELGNATLPGVRRVFDVFLTNDPDASIGATYAYTETENPLQAQFLAASKVVNFGDIAQALTSAKAAMDTQNIQNPQTQKELAYFAVAEVTIPGKRANVTANSTVDSGDISQKKVAQTSANALAGFRLRHALVSPCAVAIAEAANAAVLEEVDKNSTEPLKDRDPLQQRVNEAILKAQTLPPCDVEAATATLPVRADTIRAVIDRYIAIAAGPDPTRLQNETVYTNTPPNRFSLGAIAGGMFNVTGDDRVKLNDDGEVVADPLSGAITVAALYIHPMPYLSNASNPSRAERIRVFVGYVATPEPGLAAGAGFLLFRGLTINVGYAGMLVDERGRGVEIGKVPTASRPFERGIARTVFAGFGYSF